jgi:hypothetical protein
MGDPESTAGVEIGRILMITERLLEVTKQLADGHRSRNPGNLPSILFIMVGAKE